MNVCSYIRVSTAMQEDSPETQRQIIRAYCKRESHIIVAEYVDEAVSGGLPIMDRPAARRMMEDAKAGHFAAIVVKQLDRLGRNAADTISFPERIKKFGVQLLCCQESFADTPAGRVHYGMLAVIAQYYREDIGQKIRDHNIQVARSGRWSGGTSPFGYAYDRDRKLLVPHPQRADDVARVFRAYVECAGSREAAARMLNRLGIVAPGGGRWQSIRVKRIIANPIYDGRLRYAGEEHELAGVEPIVDADLVDQARQLYYSTIGQRSPQQSAREYTYSRVLYCADCGSRMWISGPGQASRGITPTYKCVRWIKERGCSAPGIAESRLDAMVPRGVAEILRLHGTDLRRQMYRKEDRRADQALEAAKLARERLLDAWVNGLITDRALFGRKLEELDARISNARLHERAARLDPDVVDGLTNHLEEFWPRLSVTERRGILLAVAPRIVIYSARTATATLHSPLLSEPLVLSHFHPRGRLRQ